MADGFGWVHHPDGLRTEYRLGGMPVLRGDRNGEVVWRYVRVRNYPEMSQQAIKEMNRQVGHS
jgi:hypothetical protein